MAYAPPQGGSQVPAPVSSTYCLPYVAQFVIVQKVLAFTDGSFEIHDPQGTLLFKVKGKIAFQLHVRRTLLDANGNPLVTLKKKIATMHEKWSAIRGEDDSDSSLLFTMAKSSIIQLRPAYDIFLPTNQTTTPDFKLEGNFLERNWAVLCNGNPIAEV